MKKRQYFLGLFLASILGGAIAIGGYQLIKPQDQTVQVIKSEPSAIKLASSTGMAMAAELNFVDAAKLVTPGVVHIRSTTEAKTGQRGRDPMEEFYRQFFGYPNREYKQAPRVGTGSGVIISKDGYIATNNHVVDGATDVEILLNDNRTFKAEVIGTDPTTDLALLKIDADDLPFVKLGDSDAAEVGEWVLAIGNPFEFRSTVTAGIISAKGRNINILRDKNNMAIESFIQTDAAVNPGNSGGALVNLKGELVGINTAIASPTGAFSGYSFAVPSSLVKKVIGDLKEFGVVQRALLGINIADVNAELAEEKDLKVLEGVYVLGVRPESGADEAGIRDGDVIVAINGENVKKTAELQEKVALNRPGDQILVTFLRDGKEKKVTATLKNSLNTTKAIAATNNSVIIQGATFEDVSNDEAKSLGVDGGAKLVALEKGKWKEAGIKEGFIITKIDRRVISNVEDLSASLSRSLDGSGLLIEGIYEDGLKAYYGIGW
ncbi:Do family serine endopeptidase [Reichenbachiella versicolor]|uniref:Do family serine endopeptidase n=1 Tax=Reichenbachiella versicolor TaxID=1821036 RepID=UPI000D6E8697|nr:Do family serine endopeptidase [Reichenbachiella versicolor]